MLYGRMVARRRLHSNQLSHGTSSLLFCNTSILSKQSTNSHNRKTQPPQKYPEVNSGNGSDTTSPQQKANASTSPTPSVCSKSKQSLSLKMHPRETNSSLLPDILGLKSPAKTMQTSWPHCCTMRSRRREMLLSFENLMNDLPSSRSWYPL